MSIRSRVIKLETHHKIGICHSCGGRDGAVVLYSRNNPLPRGDHLACRICGNIPQTDIYLPEKGRDSLPPTLRIEQRLQPHISYWE